MTTRSTAVCLVFLLTAGVQGQDVLFQSDLSDDDGFVVLQGPDTAFEFGYDYTFDSIPEAPNSELTGGTAQKGLRMEANVFDGLATAVAVATDGLELAGEYAVQVDIWLNYNQPAGAAGTTEYGGLSVGHDGEATGLSGASFIYDTDGDSSRDYRLYKDASEQFTDSGQYDIASVNNSGAGSPFPELFPGIDLEDAVPDQGLFGVTPDGSGGFRWMVLAALVDTEGIGAGVTQDEGTATFTLTDAETGNSVQIGTVDNSNGGDIVSMSGEVAMVFTDIFSSVSNREDLSFGVFDNLIVSSVAASDPLDCSGDGNLSNDDVACATSDTIDDLLAALGIVPGDLDLNGAVEFADFLVLSANFGDAAKGGDYTAGDIDLNNSIEFADFLVLSANFGQAAGGPGLPEPSGFLLLVSAGTLAGLLRRRS